MAWTAALGLAAVPTWEEWRYRLQPGTYDLHSCLGGWRESSLPDLLFEPLRRELDLVIGNATAFAVPALVVLAGFLGCLGRGDARVVGRRTAGCLGLVAVVLPVTPAYATEDSCGAVPVLSGEWFATVAGAWGWTQVCLLGAAVLVLAGSRAMRSEGTAAPGGGVVWRRAAASLVDYVVIVVGLSLVVGPLLVLTGAGNGYFGLGLLSVVHTSLYEPDPGGWIALAAVFLYVWGQHLRWGRTLGKRLLGVRVVFPGAGGRVPAGRTALRALLFPLLVFVPEAGPLVLVVDGLWALLVDPAGRALHDRLAGSEVTGRVAEPESQRR
ncbi:RDD family protein [Sphaerisporangium sp. B11E5]|uniref:RDD family protein n=1 Tax=Sphaerisporangium sp. B11E5 TaxID=3153563 RepID=UPI00325CB4D2